MDQQGLTEVDLTILSEKLRELFRTLTLPQRAFLSGLLVRASAAERPDAEIRPEQRLLPPLLRPVQPCPRAGREGGGM